MAPKSAATGVVRLPTTTVLPPAPAAPAPRGQAGLGMAQGPCTRPTIVTVNGQTKGTVFTPDPQFNLYTITGCMFGDRQGQAYIYGAFAAGQVSLQIEFWSDTQIVAKVVPQITGELDQNNVTLVVVPSGAPQVQKPGFKFYAMRETTLLTKIPVSAFNYKPLLDAGGSPVVPIYTTPAGQGFEGRSSGVYRTSVEPFSGGSDLFDFKGLRPGFTTESLAFQYFMLPQIGGATYQVLGSWETEWRDDNILVRWQMQHSRQQGYSYYGLSVWVSGPRGVSPWPN